jgi:hypothetical protein
MVWSSLGEPAAAAGTQLGQGPDPGMVWSSSGPPRVGEQTPQGLIGDAGAGAQLPQGGVLSAAAGSGPPTVIAASRPSAASSFGTRRFVMVGSLLVSRRCAGRPSRRPVACRR